MKTKYPLALWMRAVYEEHEEKFAVGFPLDCERDWDGPLPELSAGSWSQIGVIPRGVTVSDVNEVGEVMEFRAGGLLINSKKWVLAQTAAEYEPGKTILVKSERGR